MTFMCRTRAVSKKLVTDLDKSIFWITLIIQVFFFFFYGYSIYTNIHNIIFLITYSLLAVLAIFNFIFVITSHPYKKTESVMKIKLFSRIFKYFINGTMLGVNIFEMIKFGATDFNKIMIIVSGISLVIQIILEIVRSITSYYIELFTTSIQMDLNFVLKLAKVKEYKGNLLELLDLPLEAIANKLEGKQPELTETEIYLNELAIEFDKEVREKTKENSQKNAEIQKKEIIEHLSIIKNKVLKRKNKQSA